MLWLRNPSVDAATPNATNRAPVSPNAERMIAAAGAGVAARPAAPSTRRQATFTAT